MTCIRFSKAARAPLASCVFVIWVALAGIASAETLVLALGDSLTAGYGLAADQAFPARLQATLREQGLSVRVINAGVSGDTSAGGRARLDWSLADNPAAAIVELGANDALRGLDPEETRANLDAIILELKKRGIAVLLAGMLAPPNLGPEYEARFNAIYPDLAARHGVLFYPFFLDGVAARPELNQADGMHPTAAGVDIIVDRLLPLVRELIKAP
ncbi:MAG: arylesterase [Alphaproteobacteria bacterium]|jgi:acyl-CoA thioesterase-1|nr:arylesterase [Alphaproteobacteria bacterium]MDP7604981.1 arylesterase [Alphaproteobacteria bacterium]HJP19923.1 arylesterase [Alphaproteobacteria bacterium]